MTLASDWLRAKMVVVSSTREIRPLMKIYTKEITSIKIIRPTQYHTNKLSTNKIGEELKISDIYGYL